MSLRRCLLDRSMNTSRQLRGRKVRLLEATMKPSKGSLPDKLLNLCLVNPVSSGSPLSQFNGDSQPPYLITFNICSGCSSFPILQVVTDQPALSSARSIQLESPLMLPFPLRSFSSTDSHSAPWLATPPALAIFQLRPIFLPCQLPL